MTRKNNAMTARVLIVCDDKGEWFVRRVRTVVHDLTHDEKNYICDEPLGGPFALANAVMCVEQFLHSARE